jgi:Domain of unknown function (DUF4411)
MPYLLDSDVFIQAKNLHYSFDFCPAFWDWPQSFSVPEVRLLIVLAPGFGPVVCLLSAGCRTAVPGVPGCAPAPTAPGWSSSRVAGLICAGQAGAGRAQSCCQQVRKASFQGQSGLIFRMRWRA